MTDSGSSDLIGGALANRLEVENINAELQKRIDDGEEGIKLVEYQQVLLGITKLLWPTTPSCLPLPSKRPPAC